MRALLLCSSTDGQTRRICERLRGMLEEAGARVALTMIENAGDVAPASFDLAVIGARIRYGRTDARVIAFARRHEVDPARSVLIGSRPAHRTLAATVGARFVPVS